MTKPFYMVAPVALLETPAKSQRSMRLVQSDLRNRVGSIEDISIAHVLSSYCQEDNFDREKFLQIEKGGIVDTGFIQLTSLITFAVQAFDAVFNPLTNSFVVTTLRTPDAGDEPSDVQKHRSTYVSFEDMVRAHNHPECATHLKRLVNKVYLQVSKQGVICSKHRVAFG